jgi:hypothetical protein
VKTLRACGYSTEFNDEARIASLKAAYYLSTDFLLGVKNRLMRKSKSLRILGKEKRHGMSKTLT